MCERGAAGADGARGGEAAIFRGLGFAWDKGGQVGLALRVLSINATRVAREAVAAVGRR